MGLFDKIKDNAKNISMRAIEATREYEEDYEAQHQAAGSTVMPTDPTVQLDSSSDDTTQLANADPIGQTQDQSEAATDESVEFLIDETAPSEQENATEETAPVKKEEKSDEKPARKSKVTEISKAEHEKAEKEKRQEKTKQAAKERLAKSYTPSYKDSKSSGKIEVKDDEAEEPDTPKEAKTKKPSQTPPVGIIDITPKKLQDPLKGAIYARERAALSALASQRKLNGTVALYVANHMNFKTRVFINRVEYSGSFGKTVLPIEDIAWVKVRHGGTGVIIETAEGKRVVMVVKQADRLPFVDAIMKIQAMQPKRAKFKDTQTIRIDKLEQFGEGIDEIEKLAKLYDKGILSHDEFEAKKKQILGL